MIKRSVLFLTFILPIILLGQNNGDTGVKVQVFDGNAPTAKEDKPVKDRLGDMNMITFNAYMLPRGIFSMGYERVLHARHSLNFNAGITYRDYIFEFFQQETLELMSENNTTPKIGYMVDVNYKFWPKFYDDFEGPYISPGFAYKSYLREDKISADKLYSGSDIKKDVMQPVSYNMSELSVKFGYMYESWWLDDVIVDLYIGFGLRNASITYYRIEQIPNAGNSFVYNYNYQHSLLTPLKKSFSTPCVYLGAKLGIPF